MGRRSRSLAAGSFVLSGDAPRSRGLSLLVLHRLGSGGHRARTWCHCLLGETNNTTAVLAKFSIKAAKGLLAGGTGLKQLDLHPMLWYHNMFLLRCGHYRYDGISV